MLPRTTDPNRAGAAMPAPLRVAPANPLGSRSDPTPSIPFRTQAREPSQPFSTGDPNARIQAALAPTMAETRLPPRKKSQARLVAIVAVLFVCVAVISTALILRFQSKAVGSVLVHTDPEGATVTLDGERYGQTPLQIDEIAVGEHRLRAVRGALRGSSTIQIVENAEPQPVTIPLAPP